MKPIHVGSRVRIVEEAILGDALLGHPAQRRPEPGQMACAGRNESVTGYRRGDGGETLYALRDAPGLWPEGWIDPI